MRLNNIVNLFFLKHPLHWTKRTPEQLEEIGCYFFASAVRYEQDREAYEAMKKEILNYDFL